MSQCGRIQQYRPDLAGVHAIRQPFTSARATSDFAASVRSRTPTPGSRCSPSSYHPLWLVGCWAMESSPTATFPPSSAASLGSKLPECESLANLHFADQFHRRTPDLGPPRTPRRAPELSGTLQRVHVNPFAAVPTLAGGESGLPTPWSQADLALSPFEPDQPPLICGRPWPSGSTD